MTGVEVDPCVVTLAQANGRLRADRQIRVDCQDVMRFNTQAFDAWHFDPDRRPTAAVRRARPEGYEPQMSRFLQRTDLAACGAIKLAPAADWSTVDIVQARTSVSPSDPLAEGSVEREWIGYRRECKQQIVWIGGLAKQPGQRVATLLRASQEACQFVGKAGATVEIAAQVGRAICEPHACVLAAGLASDLARQAGLARVAAGIAYFTADRLVDHPLLETFEVHAALPYRTKKVLRWLQQHDRRVTEVKKRGVALQPAEVLSELASPGTLPVALLLFPAQRGIMAVIGSRL